MSLSFTKGTFENFPLDTYMFSRGNFDGVIGGGNSSQSVRDHLPNYRI